MAKAKPSGFIDLRDHDSTGFEASGWRGDVPEKFRRAIADLADDRVADATYRLANFGEAMSVTSWESTRRHRGS
jgi:hypothetical protein